MANTVLNDFIEECVQDICSFLQIKGVDGNIFVNDPVIKTATKLAYVLITSFCNRDFLHKEGVQEYYPTFKTPGELLRLSPVEEVTEVICGGTLLEASSYTLKGNHLVLSEDYSFLTGDDYNEYATQKVTVTYTGGLKKSNEDYTLDAALVSQAIAIYHRRSILGFSSVSSDKGTSKTPNDKGSLLDTVEEMVTKLVYVGCAEIL